MFNSIGGVTVPAGMSADELYNNAKRFQESGQIREAIAYYTAAADMGSAVAQCDLGVLYTGTNGVAANYAEAERLFTLAANQGNTVAMYDLGILYECVFSPANYDRAFHYYLMAANRGYGDAFFKTAVFYINGWGTWRDFDSAEYWSVRGLIDGDAAGCCNNFGFMLENGLGTEKNLPLAKTWYRSGAEKGMQAAAENYNRLSGVREMSLQDCKKNTSFLGTLYAAYLGDPKKQYLVASRYIKGTNCRINHPLGLYWLRRAVNNGSDQAALMLGQMYENGIAGNDLNQALSYYEKALSLGNAAAQNYINECKSMIQRGGIPVQNASTAEEYHKLAKTAETSHFPHACAFYFLTAAKMGVPDAQRAIALRYLEGNGILYDPVNAVYWITFSAETTDNPYAPFILARLFRYGSGVAQNALLAQEFINEAAKKGHPNAKDLILTYQQFVNDSGVILPHSEIDPEEAFNTGRRYENNNDWENAFFYYISAAYRGHAAAQNNVGAAFCEGHYVAPNPCSGIFWLVTAATKGDPTAMNNLAFMFENGTNVAKDPDIAAYWRNRAAEINKTAPQPSLPQQNAVPTNSPVPAGSPAPASVPSPANAPAPADPARSASAELPDNLDGYFGDMIGMKAVKEQLEKIYSFVKLNIKRNNILKERGAEVPVNAKGYNFILTGNPGTGKTTVARIISRILFDLQIRQTPEITEVDRSGLVSQYIGETELKVHDILQKVRGGTLFIDEAYTLYRENDEKDYGKQVIDVLMKDMEDNRDSYSVIIAGYKNEMMNMVRNANPGFQSRFNYIIDIPDYTDNELIEIAHMFVKKQNYLLGEGVDEAIRKWIDHNRLDDKFGNARAMREMVDKAMENQSERLIGMTDASESDLFTLTAQDFWTGSGDEQTMADCLGELNGMIGLSSVKQEVSALVNRIMVNKERESRGLQSGGGFGTLHMAFKGNAGTGKTTVARLIGKLYASIGVLKRSDVFVECSRATLVGQYQGHTAANVKKTVQQALGGILFVDEAYSLVQGEGDSFGKEAVDTLVAEMENNRDRLLVIFAGYGDDIDRFFQNNQGLKSRVPVELVFEDYTNDELFSVMNYMLKKRGLALTAAAAENARQLIAEKSRERDFGNARGVRNLVDAMIKRQNSRISQMLSNRISVPDEAFGSIEAEDIGF